jgi:sugar phosphate isomerase/epimerase
MSNKYSLAYLTTKELSPDEAVMVAAETGYDMVGFRLLPAGTEAPFPILTDKSLQQRTRSIMLETGVTLADIEIVRINDTFDLTRFDQFLSVGAELGAKHVLVAGDDLDRNRLIENYGNFCKRAAEFGMSADLEPMPWTAVTNIRDAVEVTSAVNYSNAAILVDALHYDRSESSLDDLRSIDPSRINYIQVCDAPHIETPTLDQLIHNARGERLLPGDGDIDIASMLKALPRDKVISIEIPRTHEEAIISPRERALQALKRTQQLIASL